MATARPMVSVYSADGAALESVTLPGVFTAPIRPDIVNFVHTNMAKNARQAYSVNMEAGHQSSAVSWGTGRAVSRIPRVQGGGTQRSGQGAFGNMCRGGRMFAPTKVWRKWHRKINVNQRRYALCSALAASACPPLVMARGHRIDQVPEMPLVVGGDVEGAVAKTKQAIALLAALGADADADRCADSKKLRAGVGKMRNRRYTHRRGPLVVYDDEEASLAKAVRNLPGVDTCCVSRLNLLLLAPGGHVGRFVMWTAPAFAKLDALFGAEAGAVAELKKGYVMPRACMENADLARIINSDEIQSVVRPAQKDVQRPKTAKKNPLKNLEKMLELNPYHAVHRASEMRAQAAAHDAKAKLVAAKRAGNYKVSAALKAVRADKKARKAASTAFFAKASQDGEIA
ncbi:ribosomal protein L4 domain-containing protein [Pelagophyceae sp. CCMP2097]|nr:ribosomal protein L4 domain-containing protein [Pelagophyceae sp. CCMP2097]|eukprot:CAMPEP_0184092630 /NCGR_PEP_ID=MMETSP0974-20121125/8344_1 /TAXON_ID=483370 /ORGANISM="non described non described, Strain CCMP2097" /LENGTH=399 /DNA_ID=CAMNT_0026395389 /DNA_START=37 /DNA_END=1236 /DNA_ORIENTATION=-